MMHAIAAVAMMSLLCVAPSDGRLHEPECSSFTVMEKLLEKMVRVEFNLQTVQASMLQWEAKMEALLAKAAVNMDAWQTRLDAAEASLQTQSAAMETSLQTRLDAAMETGLQTQSVAMGKQLEEALHKHKHDLQVVQDAYARPTVVFTAKDTSSSNVVKGTTIVFTTIVNNIGGGYNKGTGVFTAPYDGLYLFTTTMCSQGHENLMVNIRAAGISIASTNKYNNAGGGTCTSTSGMAVLSEGDTARVQGVYTESSAIYTGQTTENNVTYGQQEC